VELADAALVIIGCDSGLGKELVKQLAGLETPPRKIYAGCLTEEAAVQHASSSPRISGIQINVTSRDSVEAAFARIAVAETKGVFCVVNVAGAMFGGPIEWTSASVFRQEMDLNFFGLLNVIQVSMPLLKLQGKGSRFIAVTSTIAVMPSFPGLAGYASSKAAADTLINTLRLEVSPFGIEVITVCPGITRTPFLQAAREQMERAYKSAPTQVKASYGDEYAAWWAKTVQFGVDWLAQDPFDAVYSLLDASTSAWPKTRYFTGIDARLIARPTVHAPDFAWDGALKLFLLVMGQPRVAML